MSKNFTQSQVADACRVLFPGALVQQEFLQQLPLQSVKRSYRKLAKECHPDCADSVGLAQTADRFRRINNAYQLVCTFIRDRDVGAPAYRPQYKAAPTPHATSSEIRPRQQNNDRVYKPRPFYAKPVRNPEDIYYEGPLPTYRLKLGLFLYYKGVIPYSAVVSALMWQRDMRPPIGQLAAAWGWLDPHFISIIRSATEIPGSFGERAVKLGLLSEAQLSVLLLHQKMMQAHVGRYFVGKGYVTEYELSRQLREQAKFNMSIPERRRRT